MISERVCGRIEYAERFAALDEEAARAELAVVEHTCDELLTMIDARYGGLRDLGAKAKRWPIALDLQERYRDAILRRTCGRMMYRAGVQLEEIARIFGHSDTRTTAHYIGLDFEDMSAAMSKYAQYQNMRILPQMVKNELSQEKSGQSGI